LAPKQFAALSLLEYLLMYRLNKRAYREFLSRSQQDPGLKALGIEKFPHRTRICIPIATIPRTNMIPARQSSQLCLVFRGGHEYVFTHGETTKLLTVTLSNTAIKLFDKYEVTADDLAKQAVEWALVTKRGGGTIDFRTTEDLSEFCQYYFENEALEQRVC
jgi:hypothetical protein